MGNFTDCRGHIKPGDQVKFASFFACTKADNVSRHGPIEYSAPVVAVYERFVVVKLKKVVEGVNCWDILAVNGKKVGRDIGCQRRI